MLQKCNVVLHTHWVFNCFFVSMGERGGVSLKEYMYIVNLNAVVKNERNRQIMVENCVKNEPKSS